MPKNDSSYGSIPKTENDSSDFLKDEDKTDDCDDNNVQKNNCRSHYSSASLFSKATFQWMESMLECGNKKNDKNSSGNRQLEYEDLIRESGGLPLQDTTQIVLEKLEFYWNREIECHGAERASLAKAYLYAFGREFVTAGLMKLVHDLCLFVGPHVLHGLILFLQDDQAPMSQGLWLCLAITMSQLMMSLCLRSYFFQCYRVGLRLRSSTIAIVYKKIFRVSSDENKSRSTGQITNLISVDAERLGDITTYLHSLWYSCLQVSLSIFFLWGQLGASCLAGVAVIIVMVPVANVIASHMGDVQSRLMIAKDKRLNSNNELISAMKVIKLQAWEDSFRSKILSLREDELHELWNYVVANSLAFFVWSATPLMVALATFTAYVFSGHRLDVASALTSLALFEIMRFPLYMFPAVINSVVEVGVSLQRIRSFLFCSEKNQLLVQSVSNDNLVQICNASFTHYYASIVVNDFKDYETNSLNILPALLNVDFLCKQSEFVAIIGSVGSGKSSLLNSILGEMKLSSGDIYVGSNKVSYVAQNPFILNGTIRENIIFYSRAPFNRDKFRKVLHACALEEDLISLHDGDQALVGEKGITLSGGQKARISLARALYNGANLYLLDDPLSAVDTHVGEHLFHECIVKYMLAGGLEETNQNIRKPSVILVTNAVHFLKSPYVNKIYVMKEGTTLDGGKFSQLSNDPQSLLAIFLNQIKDLSEYNSDSIGSKNSNERFNFKPHFRTDEVKVIDDVTSEHAPLLTTNLSSKEVRIEDREIGSVGFDVYVTWIKSIGGIRVLLLVLVICASTQITNILPQYFLTVWSQHVGENMDESHFLKIYAILNSIAIVSTYCRDLFLLFCSYQSSRRLFINLLQGILAAPQSFFDTTPLGRVLNRFSSDISTVDDKLPDTVNMYMAAMFEVFGVLLVVAFVSPVMIIVFVPLALFYIKQQCFFSNTYRELKRLDSITRSPIYAQLSETLDGLITIRAYRIQQMMYNKMEELIDIQQLAYFLKFSSMCWLGIRLEFVGTVIIASTCLCAIAQHNSSANISSYAGLAGLAISFTLTVTQSLHWSVRMAADLEASMVSIERVKEYSYNCLPKEGERILNQPIHFRSWPRGNIVFENVNLRYRNNLPLVLKRVSVNVPAGSRVGICGRTGAGKSSLIIALLRIVEIEPGTICIDENDIRQVGLSFLRRNISVIPQDPILFGGTVRYNLDPFNEFKDQDIQNALDRVGLLSLNINEGTHLSEGGSNFSVGQRQLLAIARAILRNNKIVIMDEATASVDLETDSKINSLLKTSFGNSTVLIIAHRLNTIMDCDFILSMKDGCIESFDTPNQLLNENSGDNVFKSLVKKWRLVNSRE